MSIGRWMDKKVWYIYTMEYYLAIKKNAFESVLMRWMKLEPMFIILPLKLKPSWVFIFLPVICCFGDREDCLSKLSIPDFSKTIANTSNYLISFTSSTLKINPSKYIFIFITIAVITSKFPRDDFSFKNSPLQNVLESWESSI